MQEHQKLYDYMSHIVKRYFKFYRLRYLNASIEFEDLVQEAHIVTMLLLRKIKEGKIKNQEGIVLDINNIVEVKRFIANAVGRKLNTIRRWKTEKGFGNRTGEKICMCDFVHKNILEDYCMNCGRPVGVSYTVSIDSQEEQIEDYSSEEAEEVNYPLEEAKVKLAIEDLSEICFRHPQIKKNDFRMFCLRHMEDKTLQEIGTEYGVTRQRVEQKINRVKKVLKEYFS